MKVHQGNALDVLPTLGRYDLIVTDPPYAQVSSRNRQGEDNSVEWKQTVEVESILSALPDHLNEDGLLIVASAASGPSLVRTINAIDGLPFARILVWTKPFARNRGSGPWGWQTVPFLVFGSLRGRMKAVDNVRAHGMMFKRQGTVGHPAEMPLAVGEWLADALAERFAGGTVLDPFAGTGALVRPFESRGFTVEGIELSEKWAHYCNTGELL